MLQLLVFLNFREFREETFKPWQNHKTLKKRKENMLSKSCQWGIFTHDDISSQKHVDRKHNSYSMISGYQPHLTIMKHQIPTWALPSQQKSCLPYQRLKGPTNPANRCLLAVTMPHDFAISACIPGEIDRETPGKLTTVVFFFAPGGKTGSEMVRWFS